MFSWETRNEFFELVCGGAASRTAAAAVGVSERTGRIWWRASAPMDMMLQLGQVGGLPGPAPLLVPGVVGPEQPIRARRALTCDDRSTIGVARSLGCSLSEIARMIGRHRSVVGREVARNTGPDGEYWGSLAHRAAHQARRRPKEFKLIANPVLCAEIEDWMGQGWSPKLIALVLRRDHPHDSMWWVSHETIYQALYVQTRGRLRADLHKQLSLKRSSRRHRPGHHRRKSPYAEAFTIAQRPAEVEDRAVPGHWEGDLILGAGCGSAIGTLVERSTRFTILLHLPGRHDAASVAEAMIREMSKLPEHLRRSITWDRGTELAEYRRIQLALGAPVYFCDPHSPWQRGSNENTNRLLRFWFEKGSDLSVHTAADLQRVADTLNRRPRPTLDLQTPADRLAALLADPAAA